MWRSSKFTTLAQSIRLNSESLRTWRLRVQGGLRLRSPRRRPPRWRTEPGSVARQDELLVSLSFWSSDYGLT